MAWCSIPDVTGKVFVPDTAANDGKHPCKDCFACQNCSQERCRVCREAQQKAPCACFPEKEVAP